MDCDGTHDPIHIKKMLMLIKNKNYEMISTNRFLKKNSLSDWSYWRIFLTNLRHILIRNILNVSYDSSGAFRCYNVKKIKLKDILIAKNDSLIFGKVCFFIQKYNIADTNFHHESLGSSKMRINDIILRYIIFLLFFKT